MNAIHAFLPKCPRSLRLVFAVHLLVLPLGASETELLFDVDFSDPFHLLHQPPATGTAINRVSKVVFGSPEVVPEFGPLQDRPLVFRGRTGYDQIQFEITPGWSKYRIEYDLVTSNLQNSHFAFTVNVDTPQVRNFNLHGGLNKAYRFPGTSEDTLHQLWEDGKKSRYVIEVDISLNTWSVWQDGVHLTTGPLNASEVRAVRFGLSPAYGNAAQNLGITVALDNLKISASERIFTAPPRGPGKPGNEGILYDVDFGMPTHQAHQEPAVGAAIDEVSEIHLGSPKIVPELSGLVEHPLVLSGKERGEGIRLNIPPGWPKIRIEYDVVTLNLKNSGYKFGVSLDFRGAFQHQFLHGANNQARFWPETIPPGTWEEGAPTRYVIEIDLAGGRFRTWQNGVLMGSAGINATELHYLRFSLTPWTGGVVDDPSVVVGVDNIKVVGIDDLFPAPPENLSIDGRGDTNGILVSWPKVNFSDSYRLYRNTLDDFAGADLLVSTFQTRHIDATVDPKKRYYYWIRSMRDAQESSAAAFGSGQFEPSPPLWPSISRGERSDGIFLSWTASGRSTSYRIYRSTSRDFALAGLLAETTDTSYLDTGSDSGRIYYYWITSIWSDIESEGSASGHGVRAFAPTDNLTVKYDPETQRYDLTWVAVTGANRYTIYRSSENSFSKAVALRDVYGLQFTDNTATLPGNYFYWVVPGSSETKSLSLWSGAGASGIAENSHSSQPDLWGKNASGTPIGRGIANETGAGQSITLSAKTKRSLFGTVGIDTLSASSEAISLTGTAGNRDFKVNYFLNGNVTAAMNTGNLTIPSGADAPSIVAVVSPQRRSKGSSKSKPLALQVRGTSLRDEAASDLVILRAVMKSKR
jgi:hypothetical protein